MLFFLFFLLYTVWVVLFGYSFFLQANITEVEVSIPSKLHNSLIGSKGRFVRSIMEECGGVHIHFPTEGSGIDAVTIRGSAEEVEKAKKQLLSLAEEKVCLKGWISFKNLKLKAGNADVTLGMSSGLRVC